MATITEQLGRAVARLLDGTAVSDDLTPHPSGVGFLARHPTDTALTALPGSLLSLRHTHETRASFVAWVQRNFTTPGDVDIFVTAPGGIMAVRNPEHHDADWISCLPEYDPWWEPWAPLIGGTDDDAPVLTQRQFASLIRRGGQAIESEDVRTVLAQAVERLTVKGTTDRTIEIDRRGFVKVAGNSQSQKFEVEIPGTVNFSVPFYLGTPSRVFEVLVYVMLDEKGVRFQLVAPALASRYRLARLALADLVRSELGEAYAVSVGTFRAVPVAVE